MAFPELQKISLAFRHMHFANALFDIFADMALKNNNSGAGVGLLLLTLCFWTNITCAQQTENIKEQPVNDTTSNMEVTIPSSISQGNIFVYDLKTYYKGLGHFFSRPVHWKKRDWRNAGLVTAGTLLSVLLDEPVHDFMQRNKTDFQDGLQKVGDLGGQPVPGFVFSGTMYGLSHVFKSEWMRESAMVTVISISTAGLIQTVLKSAVGRARPIARVGNLDFIPYGPPDWHSFPSGHTIVAATTTLAIAKSFKNKWIKGAIIGLGGITAWSRVYDGAHWLSDVTLSYALSYFTVETVSKFRKSMNEKNRDKRFQYTLVPRPNGLSLVMRW